MSTVKPWAHVCDMKKSKKGNYYLDFSFFPQGVEEITIRKGDLIQLVKPEDDIQGLVNRDIITQEQADEKLAKVPDYVKFRGKLVPKKD